MSQKIQLKISINHSTRNQDREVSDVEDVVEQMLNHPDERVSDVRISQGREAGAVFVDLIYPNPNAKWSEGWTQEAIDEVKRETIRWMESEQYAENIRESSTRYDIISEDE